MKTQQGMTIGALADRTGLAVSAIRFYEDRNLIAPVRNSSGHRRFDRSDIRRLSFIKIAQEIGFSLTEVAGLLSRFPPNKRLSKSDWTLLSKTFRKDLNARIERLEKMRDTLDGCIGCGCLSLKVCQLYNREDTARRHGPGPRYLLGDSPEVK
jgi:MerR family redox-sensitive transcriptional activator SoxR